MTVGSQIGRVAEMWTTPTEESMLPFGKSRASVSRVQSSATVRPGRHTVALEDCTTVKEAVIAGAT